MLGKVYGSLLYSPQRSCGFAQNISEVYRKDLAKLGSQMRRNGYSYEPMGIHAEHGDDTNEPIVPFMERKKGAFHYCASALLLAK